jgi:hypothetical protein
MCRFVNRPLNVVDNGISVASVMMTKMFVTLMSKICPWVSLLPWAVFGQQHPKANWGNLQPWR